MLRVPKRHTKSTTSRKKPKVYPPAPPQAKALGRRIRELREAKGWTQERVAEAANLDRAYYASLEIGLRNPSFRTLTKVARGLRVSLSVLCDID